MFSTQVPDLAAMISNPIHAPIAISALSTKRFCALSLAVCAQKVLQPSQQSSLVIMVIDLHKNKMTRKDNYTLAEKAQVAIDI